nr:cysteine-rich receptor-like protein kinase [Tanacetum cinerariifolium]
MLFDFATSSARGRSGGTWMANNADLLFISVYSPQELSLKRHGDVIIMGDFNEVRFASKRHGSYFHSLNAAEFNMFIANSQLIDIPLRDIRLHGRINMRARSQIGSVLSFSRNVRSLPKPNSLVIGDIVSQEQSAFIKGRQIMDGPLILNEVISRFKARKEQLLMFKVDFQKAFDSVRWDHLDDILGKFGFRIKWRGWIRGCLQSSKASVLVNGSPTDEFSFHRGLRQGDPLSPFLFILVMESLHVSFQSLIDRGERKPRKRQNRIKIGQKREAWRSREKFKAVAVNKEEKTEQNAKRMARNAKAVKSYSSFKRKKKRKGLEMHLQESTTTRTKSAHC